MALSQPTARSIRAKQQTAIAPARSEFITIYDLPLASPNLAVRRISAVGATQPPHKNTRHALRWHSALYEVLRGFSGLFQVPRRPLAVTRACRVQPEDVKNTNTIFSDYLAYEHVRIFRQLLIKRLTLMAVAIGVAWVLRIVPTIGLSISLGLLAAVSILVWRHERHAHRRARRNFEELERSGATRVSI